MKKVKFNGTCVYPYIPDANHTQILNEFKRREEITLDAQEYEIKAQPFIKGKKIIEAHEGEIHDVPNWFYETNKDRLIEKFLHIAQFNYDNNKKAPAPFQLDQAAQHDYVKDRAKSHKVKLIELIEDLDEDRDSEKNIKKRKKEHIDISSDYQIS